MSFQLSSASLSSDRYSRMTSSRLLSETSSLPKERSRSAVGDATARRSTATAGVPSQAPCPLLPAGGGCVAGAGAGVRAAGPAVALAVRRRGRHRDRHWSLRRRRLLDGGGVWVDKDGRLAARSEEGGDLGVEIAARQLFHHRLVQPLHLDADQILVGRDVVLVLARGKDGALVKQVREDTGDRRARILGLHVIDATVVADVVVVTNDRATKRLCPKPLAIISSNRRKPC